MKVKLIQNPVIEEKEFIKIMKNYALCDKFLFLPGSLVEHKQVVTSTKDHQASQFFNTLKLPFFPVSFFPLKRGKEGRKNGSRSQRHGDGSIF